MISLSTAKRLKEAGLKWEPKIGDRFTTFECVEAGYKETELWDEEMQEAFETPEADTENMLKGSIWLPRLDQLLAEIEKRGYAWELSVDEVDKPPYAICFFSTPREIGQKWFTADSPWEVAEQALIWILEQEVRP
jgi:hypothetical protein